MKKEVIIIFFILLIVLSFIFDFEISRGISSIRNNFLDIFFIVLTIFVYGLIVLFFLLSIYLLKKNKRKELFVLWTTVVISYLVSFLMKVLVKRQRPFQMGIINIIPFLEKISYLGFDSGFSFPSMHALMVFSVLPFISKNLPKIKYAWIVLSCLIAFSRIYLGFHFLSDVIAGGLIGYGIGVLILKLKSNKIHKKKTLIKKRIR